LVFLKKNKEFLNMLQSEQKENEKKPLPGISYMESNVENQRSNFILSGHVCFVDEVILV